MLYKEERWLLYWHRVTCSGFPLDLCQVYLGEDQVGWGHDSGMGGVDKRRQRVAGVQSRHSSHKTHQKKEMLRINRGGIVILFSPSNRT